MNEHAATDPGSGAANVDVATFRSCCNTVFRVARDDDRIPLLLADVTEEPPIAGMERFSLVFHGPADRLLQQGMYAFNHDALGPLTIFIVPILGSNAERIIYQAVFSRPVQPSR